MSAATASPLGFTHNALNQLKKSRQLLDNYVAKQTAEINQIQSQKKIIYEQQCEKIKEKIQELQQIQRHRGVDSEESDSDGIQQRLNALQAKQIEFERELANLHLEKKGIQKSLNATKEEEKVAFTKAEQVRKSKERIEKSKQVTVEDLTIGLVKYRELGLDFVRCDENGALKFQFTKIDETDVDRIFGFTLKITNDDLYVVDDCEPYLDDDIVMKLVNELNETEDYPYFMRGMRRAFQERLNQ